MGCRPSQTACFLHCRERMQTTRRAQHLRPHSRKMCAPVSVCQCVSLRTQLIVVLRDSNGTMHARFNMYARQPGCMLYHVACIMSHASCCMSHVACIMLHESCCMSHALLIIRNLSYRVPQAAWVVFNEPCARARALHFFFRLPSSPHCMLPLRALVRSMQHGRNWHS